MPTETNLLSSDANSCSRLLPDEVFAQVIEHAPLIAIDLLVEDKEQRVLLGWRKKSASPKLMVCSGWPHTQK